MMLTKLKAKNQLTLPQAVVERLHLAVNEFFQVDVKPDCIRLIPMTIEPRYTPDELRAIDLLTEKQRGKARTIKPGKDFSVYIKKVTK